MLINKIPYVYASYIPKYNILYKNSFATSTIYLRLIHTQKSTNMRLKKKEKKNFTNHKVYNPQSLIYEL
jgi:hypothetical protein